MAVPLFFFVSQASHASLRSSRPVERAACLLDDEPVHIYVPLSMRPRGMPAYHLATSLPPWRVTHAPRAQTVLLVEGNERFHSLVVVPLSETSIARKSSWLTVSRAYYLGPLQSGPGIAISVDYFVSLPVTPVVTPIFVFLHRPLQKSHGHIRG